MNLVVLVTVPNEETAKTLARTLVEERLAACVNIVPGLTSVYRWEGKVVEDAELLLVIKTTEARFAALEARVRALHPYTVPEVIALPIQAGARPYLEWLAAETQG
ncbi:divalent-cation tolerance protein CutA [Marinithermus hydrothermalis]|uniref:CutA1 divalent ion tolerance protein n=1 Tax=Marinithermus hydrothermalis (strain DSM 14884 / JCM 11576 / T1) TaxID=869210 RepID=F2NLE5_MARHT|nr:divalent-cation tolerance protein CutA [Marinithermus hydrothermalis]AEB11764.1 CutA1 divalent ion tolerance protein [Marinithermus hydrothermalis DSM 14884]